MTQHSVPAQIKLYWPIGARLISQHIHLILACTKGLGSLFFCCCFMFRNSVRLVIRKVQYAPEKPGPQPMVETTRSFLMSDRSLHLEASLDKEVTTILPC